MNGGKVFLMSLTDLQNKKLASWWMSPSLFWSSKDSEEIQF